MAEITKGDVVTLKSGGPSMTVQGVRGNVVDCIWFSDKNKTIPSEHSFDSALLRKADMSSIELDF